MIQQEELEYETKLQQGIIKILLENKIIPVASDTEQYLRTWKAAEEIVMMMMKRGENDA